MTFISNRSFQWGLAGLGLCAAFAFLSHISPGFEYDISDKDKPILTLVVLLMGAGAVYLFVVGFLKSRVLSRGLILWVFAVGLFLRLSMFPSVPMLEDDHFRYMWDGAVLANGFNPYKYAPRDLIYGKNDAIPEKLRELAEQSGPVVKRINHPWLRTIYPPLTQGAFALAYIIRPWNLVAWRIILLAMDFMALYLLFTILSRLNLSMVGLVIYWWNPLLVKEIYNSCHMEMIMIPFLMGALLLSIQGRYLWATVALGFALGAKFWPAILLPVVLRPVLKEPRRAALYFLLFMAFFTATMVPFILTGLKSGSGFTAYGRYWEMNDALFMLILWTVQSTIKIFSLSLWNAQAVTRTLILCFLFGWTLWVIRKNDPNPHEWNRRFLLITAGLFLLSPTQFPWYYLWVFPFLTLEPRFSLLLLTALLPLYYLRPWFETKNMVRSFDNGIVWIEFAPVWILLFLEWVKRGRLRAEP